MKILLINPPQTYNLGENPFVVFPLGLGYIASVLKKNKFNISILDCIGEGNNNKTFYLKDKYLLGLSFNEIKHRIILINPDIVLISCSSSVQYNIILKIAEIVKKFNNSIKVIVGGHHVSALPKEVLKNKNINYIILGEGELTISKLINALSNNENIENINSLGYKKGKKIIINGKQDLVEKLDSIPFPARELFPFEKYATSKYKQSMLLTKRKVAEVITSRGCPYGCTFCASHLISGKEWRKRSVKNVIQEIKILVNNYDIEEIHFVDDNIILDKERFKSLCKELIKINIRWTVPNGINISCLDKNLIDLMKKSGCYALFMPIESGSEATLSKYIRKDINFTHIKTMVAYAYKEGFYQVGFFLLGFYEETREDIEKTIKFASELEIDEAHFSIVTPLPGSEYYKQVENLIQNYDYHSSKNANIDTKYLTKEMIEKLRNKAYLYFELNKLLKKPLSYFNKTQIKRLYRYGKYLTLSK